MTRRIVSARPRRMIDAAVALNFAHFPINLKFYGVSA